MTRFGLQLPSFTYPVADAELFEHVAGLAVAAEESGFDSDHVARIIAAPTPEAQKELVRSEDSFNLWQSILRGAGVITGCRKCADVCPVGADYQTMLSDALDAIPDSTPSKEARADAMQAEESADRMPATYAAKQRWIGKAQRRA